MIETERLLLRVHRMDDFGGLHAMQVDPEVYRHIAGAPASEEGSWHRLLRTIGHWTLFGYGLFAVTTRATDSYIGIAGLAHFRRGLGAGFDDAPEAAWSLASAMHGKGYAREAVVAAHDWFAAAHGVKRTVCIISPENTASLRLAERVGYRAYDRASYKGESVTMLERTPV